MVLRMLPGVMVTLALAAILYLASRPNGATLPVGTRSGTVGRPPAPPVATRAHTNPVFPDIRERDTPQAPAYVPAPFPGDRPAPTLRERLLSENAQRVTMAPGPARAGGEAFPPRGQSAARAFPAASAEGTSAMAAPASAKANSSAPQPASPITNVRNIRVGMAPARPGAVASHDALASLEDFDACLPPANYRALDLPERGISVYGEARGHSANQSMRREGNSFYKSRGLTYSVGFMHEWSIDSSFGLGVDFLDYEIKNRRTDNRIKNDVRGFIVNGDYEGSVLGKYPLNARAFYGRTRTTGSGSIEDMDPGNPGVMLPWREDRHNSFLYGGELKVGIPLIGTNDIKFLPEFGVRFVRVKTKSYQADIADIPTRMASADSRSFTMPLTVTVKKDFLQCWGIVTPSLVLGYTREFEKGAIAAHTFNSMAASAFYYDSTKSHDGPYHDEIQKNFMQFGVGLDIATVGGWQIMADYRHHWSSKYRNDTFKLELGRCF